MPRCFLAATVVAGLLALTGCIVEQPVVVSQPPAVPPPRVEAAPVSPGPAYAWVPGHWYWRGPRRGYVWVPGYYSIPAQPGYVWVPGFWTPRPGGYVWVEGHWRPR